MNYEQKYNEALERAKEFYNDKDNIRYANAEGMLEDIFPELKESEDELTWLTKYIEEEAYSLSMDIRDNEDCTKLKNLRKALAWLEKQGEQKPIIEMITPEESLGIDSETYNEIVNACIFGENKPKFKVGDTIKKESTGDIVTISEIDLKNREYRLSNTGFIPFKYEHLWELVEQKPAWSEEDEVMIKVFDSIIRYIVEVVDKDVLERFGTNREELFSWLKKLKQRIGGEQ